MDPFIPAIPENAMTGRSGMSLPVIVEGAFTSELVAHQLVDSAKGCSLYLC